MISGQLPSGFDALEPFVERWERADFQARFLTRYESDMDEIRAFYEAITPLADKALEHLSDHDFTDLAPPEATLLKLLLALAHIAIPVERYGQPRPKSVTWPTTLVVTQGSFPS